jgi:hypothetical protein
MVKNAQKLIEHCKIPCLYTTSFKIKRKICKPEKMHNPIKMGLFDQIFPVLQTHKNVLGSVRFEPLRLFLNRLIKIFLYFLLKTSQYQYRKK